VVLTLAFAAGIRSLVGPTAAAAALVGGLLALGNLAFLGWLVARLNQQATQSAPRWKVPVLLAVKLPVLLVAVYVCIVPLGLSVPGFMAGLSTLVVTLVVAGFLEARRPSS
jgi:hypothetical protein